MADDKKNIGPKAEKPGDAPQEKKAEPIKDMPPAPEQPAPGAAEFDLEPVCVYAVVREGEETCGMLFRAEIRAFGPLEHEIEELSVTESLPERWTYPDIQPYLLQKLTQ